MRVLRFLEEAEVVSLAPFGSNNRTEKWRVDTVSVQSHAFPVRRSAKPGHLAGAPSGFCREFDCDRLLGDETQRDNVKFWAGSGGYPGVGLVRDALCLVRGRTADHVDAPFSLTAEQSSSFRFDWRRDYVPIDSGFSLNPHGHMTTQGYPVVELMAAIGVTHARPMAA